MNQSPVDIDLSALPPDTPRWYRPPVQQPTGQNDKPVVTIDLVYWTGVALVLVVVALVAVGSFIASTALIHSVDLQVRLGMAWAWEQLQALYWAGRNLLE